MKGEKITRLIWQYGVITYENIPVFDTVKKSYRRIFPGYKPTELGRWKIDKCAQTLERSTYLNNMDNCGVSHYKKD